MDAAALDALVAAYEPGPGPGGLRALVPLAGRPLVEHQLRRAAAAGAGRLLLLVDEMPQELAAVVTQLRREGLVVEPVAGLDLVAEALPSDRVCLLVADACLPDEAVLRRLAAVPAPALATLPDDLANERHERMDAQARWAGVALLDGGRIADAAAMLGTWDPVSTLLRRAVQEGAARLDVADDPPVLLLGPADLAGADARIVVAARARPRDWVERWVEAPLLARLVPALVRRDTAPETLAWPAAGAMLLAGTLALGGWRWLPLLLLLVASPALAAARQLARVADRPLAAARALRHAGGLGASLGVLGLALGLWRGGGQWGWLLAGALLLLAVALAGQMRALAPGALPRWLAGARPLAWMLLPFALIGRWDWGLAALLGYAGVSAGVLYRALVARAAGHAGLAAPKLF